jgi:hypothetical protein
MGFPEGKIFSNVLVGTGIRTVTDAIAATYKLLTIATCGPS